MLNRLILPAAASLALLPALLTAGEVTSGKSPKAPPPPVAEPEAPFVTGAISLMANTHFISYGQDVWGGGSKWDDLLFNPAIDLNFNLGGGWSAYLNLWGDVNDNATSDIGGDVQEIDVNVGIAYTVDKWKFSLGYGAWMYAEQIEHIVDGKISYNDGLLNPFLMLHGRVADQISFDTGLVAQVGIAPGYALGPVSLSFPITASFNTTDNFHGGDAGFAFVSAGIGATIPLVKHVALSLSATYYHTMDDVIPVNVDDDFVTGAAGIVISF
jgi:hypothetical protein